MFLARIYPREIRQTPMKSFLVRGHIAVKALHKQKYRVNEYKLWFTLPHLRLLNFAPNC